MAEIRTNEVWLGIDPDLHSTALAIADAARVYSVAVIRAEGGALGMLREIAARMPALLHSMTGARVAHAFIKGVAVESQHYRMKGSAEKAMPEDLIRLATVSGAALLACAMLGDYALLNPMPSEWKGSLDKFRHQAQTCMKYGWSFKKKGGKKPYAVPDSFGLMPPAGLGDLNDGDWKHVMDAIGLARWGACRATPERLMGSTTESV